MLDGKLLFLQLVECESSVTTGVHYRSDRRQPLLEDRARKRPPVGGEQELSDGSNRSVVSTYIYIYLYY